jgi:hypothetical protein
MRRSTLVIAILALVALSTAAPALPKTLPQLFGTVGPGSTFRLENKGGSPFRALKAGKYTVTVQDFSQQQNFHLVGPGLNVKTSVKGKGSSGWAVVLRAGTFRYFSDGSPTRLKGSFSVK